MNTAFHTTTTVLPGDKIEIVVPDAREGDRVQVMVSPTAWPPRPRTGPSGLEIIESLKGHRLFQSVEEVDKHINEERDSWDR